MGFVGMSDANYSGIRKENKKVEIELVKKKK